MKKQTTLRNLREQAGKTVKEVAEILNVSEREAYHYEQGYRKISIEQILPLCNLYDCSCEEIIDAQLASIQIRHPK